MAQPLLPLQALLDAGTVRSIAGAVLVGLAGRADDRRLGTGLALRGPTPHVERAPRDPGQSA